jgi:cytochrome c oxidase subunit 2
MSPNIALFSLIRDWLPQGSEMATQVDSIITGLLIAASVVCVVLTVVTVYILIRYRRGSKASRARVEISTWKIETVWTIATLSVFLYFFVRGATAYVEMERTPAETGVVNIVARQWMWDMRYDDGRREFNVLHLRQNTPVRLVISSEDVIHSFFVPAFRLKQDAVPGRITSAWVNPTRAGTYRLYCAQYCGTAHAEMGGMVIVLPPADYDAWERRANISGDPSLSRGKEVFAKYGCGSCHEDRSVNRAPSLIGLYGTQVTLYDGRIVTADEQYLHDAILVAPKYSVAGFPPIMPTYTGIISGPEVAELISYIRSLGVSRAPLASNP